MSKSIAGVTTSARASVGGGATGDVEGSVGSGVPTGVGAGAAGDVEGSAIAELWDEGGVGLGALAGPDDQTVTATRTTPRPTPPTASRAPPRRRSKAFRDPAPDPFMAARSSLDFGGAGFDT